MEKKSFLKLKTSPFNPKYMYVYLDTPDYLADAIFIKNGIKSLKFKKEFHRPNEKYAVITCTVSRRENEQFLQAMSDLENKMLLCCHNDYIDFATGFFYAMQNESTT